MLKEISNKRLSLIKIIIIKIELPNNTILYNILYTSREGVCCSFIITKDTVLVFGCIFQAPCQVELENWVNSIHSACAAAFARHRGKTGTLHLLQEEIFRLEKAIESVGKYVLVIKIIVLPSFIQ